uniref:Acyltransferase PGAP2 n=1 Tax=Naja naja TaxID=35670 RepID=A0A8C6Y279_NAJNA
MFFTCLLWWLTKKYTISAEECKFYKWKWWLFLFNLLAFLLSICAYFRHNWYCEAGVYTVFAFLEYLEVPGDLFQHGLPHDTSPLVGFCNKELVVASQSQERRF